MNKNTFYITPRGGGVLLVSCSRFSSISHVLPHNFVLMTWEVPRGTRVNVKTDRVE
jgi:hypothetical protein